MRLLIIVFSLILAKGFVSNEPVGGLVYYRDFNLSPVCGRDSFGLVFNIQNTSETPVRLFAFRLNLEQAIIYINRKAFYSCDTVVCMPGDTVTVRIRFKRQEKGYTAGEMKFESDLKQFEENSVKINFNVKSIFITQSSENQVIDYSCVDSFQLRLWQPDADYRKYQILYRTEETSRENRVKPTRTVSDYEYYTFFRKDTGIYTIRQFHPGCSGKIIELSLK